MAEMEPPIKKAKTTQDMDQFIEKIINSDINLTAILDDAYTKPLPVTKCYAGTVTDTKQLSRIILLLNEKQPLTNLQHLKRVNRRSVLICSVSDFNEMKHENIQEYLDAALPELKNAFECIKELDVPAVAPLTKRQSNESRSTWPCNFHPVPYIETLISDSVFNQSDLRLHRTFMGMALEIAKVYCDTVEDVKCCDSNAAVVVDPKAKSVVAIAIDNRKENPTQHATMVAIDNVAKTQNGGAWDDNKLATEAIANVREKFPKILFDARKFVSKKEETDVNKADDSPYLCTGYDIYLIREPCVMCAMGLVHARIKRVFYVFENSTLGALNSKTKLHCVKHLNHRFEVFTGF